MRVLISKNCAVKTYIYSIFAALMENATQGANNRGMPSMKNEITRYSDAELKVFESLINEKLEAARGQLEFYMTQLHEMAENPDTKVKGLDDGLSTVESERLTTLAGRQRKLISHLENALIRIKNKIYGVCRETGVLIAKERLMAVPHATLSIAAKQTKNK
jgi:RNA polymerase-binding transcription factor